jgi:catechol 2,3-dioxygenase-like lactoylglutathione lyase family enzyme
MLSSAKLQTIMHTTRLVHAERFYSHVLGLRIKCRRHGGVVFDVGGEELLLFPVPSHTPSEHTVLGFAVTDLSSVMAELRARGLEWVRIPGWEYREDGVLVTPDGAQVVWFRDPDGNALSIVQYAESPPSGFGS